MPDTAHADISSIANYTKRNRHHNHENPASRLDDSLLRYYRASVYAFRNISTLLSYIACMYSYCILYIANNQTSFRKVEEYFSIPLS